MRDHAVRRPRRLPLRRPAGAPAPAVTRLRPGAPALAAASHLLESYEAIAGISQQMLAAARDEAWDEVARLESRCRELIAELSAAARSERLTPGEQRRRVELLRGILADDAEIRARSEPWLRRLEHLVAAPAFASGRPSAAVVLPSQAGATDGGDTKDERARDRPDAPADPGR